MKNKLLLLLVAVIIVFTMILPAMSAEDLVLDITSVARAEMVPQGYEWFVKPGTYQGF